MIAEDTRFKEVLAALQSDNTGILEEAICEEFPVLSFYPAEDLPVYVDNVQADSVGVSGTMIIGIGDNQCTISFEATVDYSVDIEVEFDDPATGFVISPAGTVRDSAYVSGIAKLSFSNDWKSISAIDLISIDDDSIAVTTKPDGLNYEE